MSEATDGKRLRSAGCLAQVGSGDNPWVHRVFAAIITLAALFVAWLGFAEPERMDRAFTWASLPPLHAAFVGSLYLFGAVLVGGSAIASHRAQWGGVIVAVAIFTSSMLLLTVLNTEAFDWALGPVKGWIISYAVYPPIAWTLAVWVARRPMSTAGGKRLGATVKRVLQAMAFAFAFFGVALLVFRGAMADAWPWKVSDGVAQFYGGPFLAIAWAAAWYSRRRYRSDLVVYAPAIVVLSVATLVASFDHRRLFESSDPAAWVWFGVFGVLGTAHLYLAAEAWRNRRG